MMSARFFLYVELPKVHEGLTPLFTEADNCTQSTTEIAVPYSTIDDRPHWTIMYMYLRGGSRCVHNGGRFISEITKDTHVL
jgi:hypothetical protein